MKRYNETYKTVFTVFVLVLLVVAAFGTAYMATLLVNGEIELVDIVKGVREVTLPPLPWELL